MRLAALPEIDPVFCRRAMTRSWSLYRGTRFGDLEILESGQMFTPKLEILLAAQRRLWDELRGTPQEFVLYGGTALALRLGHRTSEDFDFFSNNSFAPDVPRKGIPYLQDAELSQFEPNTLTAIVDRDGPVKVSFFGALKLNRVQDPDVTPDTGTSQL
jgi:hypothetical protein